MKLPPGATASGVIQWYGEIGLGRTQYFVSLLSGEWIVTRDNEQLGTLATRQMAIEAAIEAAGNLGGRADVLVQGRDNQFKLEWSSGRDHDPRPA